MEGDRAAEALTEAQGRIRGMMMIYDSCIARRISGGFAAGYLGDPYQGTSSPSAGNRRESR